MAVLMATRGVEREVSGSVAGSSTCLNCCQLEQDERGGDEKARVDIVQAVADIDDDLKEDDEDY